MKHKHTNNGALDHQHERMQRKHWTQTAQGRVRLAEIQKERWARKHEQHSIKIIHPDQDLQAIGTILEAAIQLSQPARAYIAVRLAELV